MKQWFKEFIHNCVVHPLMMVLPSDKATRLHAVNANYTFGLENRYDELFLETGEVSDETIKRIFIQNGFKEKLQPDGKYDLNPYVYQAARELIKYVRQ